VHVLASSYGLWLLVQLSLDLLQEWLSKWGDNLLDLSENAGYVDFSGLQSFRIVSICIPCSCSFHVYIHVCVAGRVIGCSGTPLLLYVKAIVLYARFAVLWIQELEVRCLQGSWEW
jgi:hypothetical protein